MEGTLPVRDMNVTAHEYQTSAPPALLSDRVTSTVPTSGRLSSAAFIAAGSSFQINHTAAESAPVESGKYS
jgi:hypothetical protein